MYRFILLMPLLGLLACDSSEDKAASPTDAAKPAAPEPNDGQGVPTASPAKPIAPGAKAIPKTDCKDFSFELDQPTDETLAKPNRDDPVGRATHTQNVSLKFTCGDDERIEDIDSLNFDCHGASCGCAYAIDREGVVEPAENPEECGVSSDDETSAFLKAGAAEDVLTSWAVITAVERALIVETLRYDIKTVEGGFDVVRTSSTEETKTVFKHR